METDVQRYLGDCRQMLLMKSVPCPGDRRKREKERRDKA